MPSLIEVVMGLCAKLYGDLSSRPSQQGSEGGGGSQGLLNWEKRHSNVKGNGSLPAHCSLVSNFSETVSISDLMVRLSLMMSTNSPVEKN